MELVFFLFRLTGLRSPLCSTYRRFVWLETPATTTRKTVATHYFKNRNSLYVHFVCNIYLYVRPLDIDSSCFMFCVFLMEKYVKQLSHIKNTLKFVAPQWVIIPSTETIRTSTPNIRNFMVSKNCVRINRSLTNFTNFVCISTIFLIF